MPLSELYRSVDGKKEHSQQKSNDVSYIPNDEFVELIWERGQVMVQGQSSKIKKIPISSNFQFQTSKHQEKDDLLDVHGLNQDDDDDMVPWLNYPLDDYCSDLLPELSGITVHEPPSRVHKDPGSVITGLDHSNTSKGSSRTGNLFTFSDPMVRLGVSDIGNSSRSKPQNIVHKDPVGGGEKTILNFSHFSRPAAKAMAKANAQNQDHVHHGAVNHEPRKETGQPSLDPVKVGPNLSTKPVDEPHCVDKSTNDVNGGKETVKSNEPIRACSSVCSGNSAERASNDLTKSSKRKSRDMEDSECQSQGDEEESLGTKNARGSRNRTGSKRSRAAEVHNLSERRRRDRINEKMRALQELIPNCNKVDKASMLDEAIEYLKTLQLQVQIMSMGTGLCMPPMMFPSGMQHMSHMGIGMGMGYGMGMGMDGGPHMFPFSPTAYGSRHPSIYGHPSQGMPVLLPQTHMPGIPIYPPVRQVGVPDVGLSSKDFMNNKNPNAMAQTSSQSQDANKSLNQSTSVDT